MRIPTRTPSVRPDACNLDPPVAADRVRILFTSTSYPSDSTDWKGRFIQRMLTSLAARDSFQVQAWCPPGDLPASVACVHQDDDEAWLRNLLAGGGIAHMLRTQPVRGTRAAAGLVSRLRRACLTVRPDIYHVNWLQCALALPLDRKPALVTILGTDMQLLRLPFVRRLLARRFRHRRVALCPNAEWMVPILRRTFPVVAQVCFVPFGIDTDWYATTRSIPTDAPHRWICVTRLTEGKIGYLFEWAAPHFKDRSRELHLLGPHQDSSIRIPDWVHYHGAASPSELRSHWFPQATGLISLSTHPEGRPQVMLEAMASGLPILASANAAHIDLVEHERTGWICSAPSDLASGLSRLEDRTCNQAIGQRAREAARVRFGDWDDCAGRYADVYRGLLQ